MRAELPALRQVLEALQQGASHDALVCCAGYVLGEYGRLVKEVPTHVQFALLHERFLTVSNETKVGVKRRAHATDFVTAACELSQESCRPCSCDMF